MASPQSETFELRVLELIEEFEDKLEGYPTVPLTGKILVDRNELINIIKDINVLLPDEYQHVRWMKAQQNQLMEEATREAETLLNNAQTQEYMILERAKSKEYETVAQAEQRAKLLVDEHEIVKLAQKKAQEIIREAEALALDIKNGTYNYAIELMRNVEFNMSKMLQTVQENIDELDDYKTEFSQPSQQKSHSKR